MYLLSILYKDLRPMCTNSQHGHIKILNNKIVDL